MTPRPTVPPMLARAPLRLALALVALAVALPATPTLAQADDPIVIYLVRHSERAEDGTNDPPTSAEGRERSELVATMLADAGITHIHTTDLKRTRETGAPTAAQAGLDMQVYGPRDLTGFAERLRTTPGRHLVLGHSNTTTAVVEALGGDPGSPIATMEYDRFYIVTVAGDAVSTVLLRFGRPYRD